MIADVTKVDDSKKEMTIMMTRKVVQALKNR